MSTASGVTNNEGLQKLWDELNNTAVLSGSFKTRILTLVDKALDHAYESGREAGRQEGKK